MIPLFKVHVPDDLSLVMETLRSGYVTQGPRVDEFELKLRSLLGTPHVLSLNSGTSALTLAYRLAGVGPKSAVITTPMTCSATNLPILTAGARPIFADVDPRTGLIDLEDVERIVIRSKRVDAIVGVDWGGTPCDHGGLVRIAKTCDAYAIADSAHALGAVTQGRPVGSVADMTCFSFQAIKHMTTIDGGILSFSDALGMELAYRRGRLLRWYGIDRDAKVPGDSRIDIDIVEAGYKFHMNDVAATLGLAQLPHLEDVIRRHRRNAKLLREALNESYFHVPRVRGGDVSSWWVLTVLLPGRAQRDAFRLHMLARGVQVSQVHRRNDTYSVFRPWATRPLPGVDEFSDRMICLPCHWALTDEDVLKIAWTANVFTMKVEARA